ncbi:prominin-1 [Echinops telfairi]|uniref:Prominin-1 n=1 Tax=Echinops telfairi TaxID=9371 RepID=A0AC55CJB4_ECHTE|nr:prominin-1 [Echinops telfairi]
MAPVHGCLLLLLGLSRSTFARPPSSTRDPNGLRFNLPVAHYETSSSPDWGPITPLFGLVHAFLHVVQPHDFPEATVRKLIYNKFDIFNDYKEVVHYEIGLIICACLGLLFVVLMPLVGCCFCLCRCCDHCGGEMHQRQKKNGPFLKKAFTLSLLVLCILISIGIAYGFLANHHLRTRIRGARALVGSNVKDLRTFLNETPVVRTTPLLLYPVWPYIKPLLGGQIHHRLKPKVIPVLEDIRAMGTVIRETQVALEKVNSTLEELRNRAGELSANLSDIKSHLDRSLNDSTCSQNPETCDSIRRSLGQLETDNNLQQLPSVEGQLDSVNRVLRTDLVGLAQQGYKTFNDIPEMVQNQTTNVISDIRTVLDSIGSTLSKVTDQVPIQDIIANITGYINDTEAYIGSYFYTLEKYESYRWLGCLVVCCLLTLIVLFYSLGLLCGTCGYHEHATPTTRGCVSNTGGIFLMAGVGLSFLVCWILMTVVVLTFFVGGNVEKLVCEPYQNRKLFRFALNAMNGDDFILMNLLTISLIIPQYTEDINNKFNQLNIDFGNIVLLNDAGRQNLGDFVATGINQINYTAYLMEASKPPTKMNLLSFAENLDETASHLPQGTLKDSLIASVQSMKAVYQHQVIPLERSMVSIGGLWSLSSFSHGPVQAQDWKARVKEITVSLDSAQDFIQHNVSSIIVDESKAYLNTIIGYFEQYVQWVKNSITGKIAACKPVATALDSAVDVFLCSYVVDPMNLFWFGVGKATMLLLPALILAVKLAKYYRRMESEDVYEDVETVPMKNLEYGNNGYHKDHLYGIPNPFMTRFPAAPQENTVLGNKSQRSSMVHES